MFYAQLDVNNICVGVADLAGVVSEYNYTSAEDFDPVTGVTVIGEPVFTSRMIEITKYSTAYLGLHYTDDGKWERVS